MYACIRRISPGYEIQEFARISHILSARLLRNSFMEKCQSIESERTQMNHVSASLHSIAGRSGSDSSEPKRAGPERAVQRDRPDVPTGQQNATVGGNDLTVGMQFHQYELIRELGRGGMGVVFLARDTRLGRRVAIKFLHSASAEITQRFLVEARTTAQCSHENIVVIHEVGEYRGIPYMVLEYLQGQPLSHVIGGQRISPTRAVELIVPVVRALQCAHERNIVHRDLKPDNIFVTDSGTVKVLDFGIAKVLEQGAATPITSFSDMVGALAGTDISLGELTRKCLKT